MNAWKHFCTITHHKILVMKGCFAVGLYRQGLLHDLSKYSPTEFLVGCRYYQGTKSPNGAEREAIGYSSAWLHHKGRNKHHLEYWIDYGVAEDKGSGTREHKGICGMKMPVKYVVEMYVDRVSASRNYLKDDYTDDSPLQYYSSGKQFYIMHEDTRALLELLLVMLSLRGEAVVNDFIRKGVLTGIIPYEKAKLDAMQEELWEYPRGDGQPGRQAQA
ncbi:MAG: DUF5662 family protein [Roseburia sp.]